ncbi:hypothetical protein GCM10027168_66190 [Streptomyces capparidis]
MLCRLQERRGGAGMITCTPYGKTTTLADGGDTGTALIIRTTADATATSKGTACTTPCSASPASTASPSPADR